MYSFAGDLNQTDFVQRFPREVSEEIFQYLSSKDLASCSAVSTAWREAINSNKVWGYLCDTKGFKDDFDPSFSHFCRAHKQFRKWAHSYDSFTPMCQKRLLYNKHSCLQKNWRCGKYVTHKVPNEVCQSFFQLFEPVSCDGRYLVMLEKPSKNSTTSTLGVWSLDGVPFKLCELSLAQKVDPVEAVAFDNGTIVVAQAWIIIVYHLKNSEFVNAYEIHDLRELEPKTNLPKEMKRMTPHLKVTQDFIICVPSHSHSTVDFVPIFFWDRATGQVKHKLFFESMYHIISNAEWFDDSCYLSVINKKKKSYHILEFSSSKATWEHFNETISMEIEQLAASKNYILAVTKSTNPSIRAYFSPRSEHLSRELWLWDRTTGSALRSLQAHGKSFQFIDDFLMFFDSSKVTVMNPKSPDITSEFEVSGTISSIKASCHPSIMVIIKTGCYIEVWDWGLGCRLYTVASEISYGSQLWCDDKRIITYHSADNAVAGGILVLGFW